MHSIDRLLRVGPVGVRLRADEPALVDYLAEFYEVADDVPDAGAWTVDAAVGSIEGLPSPNRWGVSQEADGVSRVVKVRASDATSLAITVRKIVREALVEHCECRRYTMLHASAFADDDRVVIIVGDKGSGKTTLALRASLDHGSRFVSNDHLILFAEPNGDPFAEHLRLTSLPTLIPVKVGTYLDLEDRLPQPWDDEGLDLDRFRALPLADRYTHSDRLLFTYRRLGQANPVEVKLRATGEGPAVVVVLASYAPHGQQPGAIQVVNNPEAALWPHVRFDWVFDQTLNTQHLPRTQRDPDSYGVDTRRLLIALADRAEVVSWTHTGDPTPLITWLDAQRRRPCFR